MSERTVKVLLEVQIERYKQNKKWGEQHHPDGTSAAFQDLADIAKERTEAAAKAGQVSWKDILEEEMFEAFAESDSEKLRHELIQVAAVAVAWIEDIDSRKKTEN